MQTLTALWSTQWSGAKIDSHVKTAPLTGQLASKNFFLYIFEYMFIYKYGHEREACQGSFAHAVQQSWSENSNILGKQLFVIFFFLLRGTLLSASFKWRIYRPILIQKKPFVVSSHWLNFRSDNKMLRQWWTTKRFLILMIERLDFSSRMKSIFYKALITSMVIWKK